MNNNNNDNFSTIPPEIKSIFEDFRDVSDEIKNLEDKIKIIKSDKTKLGSKIIEFLDSSDIDKISICDRTFYVRKKIVSRIIGDKEIFYKELEKQGEDSIISRYIFPQTLNSWVKERIENNEEISQQLEVIELRLPGMRKS